MDDPVLRGAARAVAGTNLWTSWPQVLDNAAFAVEKKTARRSRGAPARAFAQSAGPRCGSRQRRSSRALAITLTLESAMAAPATTGLR